MRLLSAIVILLCIICTGCKKDNAVDPPDANGAIRDTGNGIWRSFNTKNSGIPHDWIMAVEVDRMNNIWVGTFEHGIGKYDGKQWTVYNTKNSGLVSDEIHSISSDSKGNIWIGTSYGLSRLGYDNSWTSYTASDSVLPYRVVSSVKVDKNDVLWLGCGHVAGGGLMSFDGHNWKLFTTENSKLPCSVINDIEIDEFNNKIIATHQYQGKGGVVIISPDGSWTVLQKSNVLFDYKGAEAVSIDNNNHIWAAMRAVEYEKAGGLWEYDGSKIIDRNPAYTGKLSRRVSALANDRNGLTWIAATPEDKYNYELAVYYKDKWYLMTELFRDFPRLYVPDMIADKDNGVLLGSQTGLLIIKLDPSLLK